MAYKNYSREQLEFLEVSRAMCWVAKLALAKGNVDDAVMAASDLREFYENDPSDGEPSQGESLAAAMLAAEVFDALNGWKSAKGMLDNTEHKWTKQSLGAKLSNRYTLSRWLGESIWASVKPETELSFGNRRLNSRVLRIDAPVKALVAYAVARVLTMGEHMERRIHKCANRLCDGRPYYFDDSPKGRAKQYCCKPCGDRTRQRFFKKSRTK